MTKDETGDVQRSPLKLLFIDTFLLGDLIYLGAMIGALRDQMPNIKMDLLASDATVGFPFLNRFNVDVHHFSFPWNRIGWHRRPIYFAHTLFELRKEFKGKFQDYVVIDSRGDFRHDIISSLLKPRKSLRYYSGAKKKESWRGVLPKHPFICRQHFAYQIAEEFEMVTKPKLQWPWLADFKQKDSCNRVLLAPEASNGFRYWDSAKWKSVSRLLQRDGFIVTLIVHHGNAIRDVCAKDFNDIWRGSIIELANLIGGSRAVIGVDSFVGHLAAAIGTPVVSLFGPQLPALWKPWGKNNVTVSKPFDCRPCSQKKCEYLDRSENNCMSAIQVEDVMYAFSNIQGSEKVD